MNYPKYFATGNRNKLREVNSILEEKLEQIDLDLVEIQSTDVIEVVKAKAIQAYKETGKIVLVEDTGLSFVAWNNLPGALIKWFLEEVELSEIIKMLESFENKEVVAHTAFCFFDGSKTHIFEAKIKGSVAKEIKGEEGFGWDALFIPEGGTKSFAEMNPEEKNKISMRRLALEKLANISVGQPTS
ncbi:RdgB/HAM1 family non-canonical purine NTP pyrophosphatase [Candidatus Wolfebacteria bacterium]|nr:RdgB/HAM1 family non-canonical purine NTP pyrophosphatase [Candidatus Wolfebacteria bacterium]